MTILEALHAVVTLPLWVVFVGLIAFGVVLMLWSD